MLQIEQDEKEESFRSIRQVSDTIAGQCVGTTAIQHSAIVNGERGIVGLFFSLVSAFLSLCSPGIFVPLFTGLSRKACTSVNITDKK